MDVIRLKNALADLREIRDYYETRNPPVARAIGQHLLEAADRLEVFPHSAPNTTAVVVC